MVLDTAVDDGGKIVFKHERHEGGMNSQLLSDYEIALLKGVTSYERYVFTTHGKSELCGGTVLSLANGNDDAAASL